MDQNQSIECGEVKENEVNSRKRAHKPNWLEELLNVKFFKSCVAHRELRKNETNMFCTECVRRICHHCLPRHTLHDTLQVRKYVYQDVVRLRDIQKHLDCSQVQSYSINSSKAVFLNPRPQTKPPKPLGSECVTCGRSLQAPYRYCSIACKVLSLKLVDA
ncbi:protein RGF1 INDUCIBLE TRANSCRIPTION FACTOR 1 [Nymphaea colorata]|nr:protein RGF1 INDUCIBLE TRANSCRIPTION FACTOR 1 [Nymphaea colorata]